MKHPFALILTYKSLEGHEYTIDWLRRETAEDRTASLERLNDADVAGWLSGEQLTSITALLGEADAADEALTVNVDESTYPLYIIANAGTTVEATLEGVQLTEGFSEMNTEAYNEASMCDGGPSRKETLRHAREAFRQIGSISETVTTIPSMFESFENRLSALEGKVVPQPAPAPAVVETPTTEATTETSVAETPATETVASTADVPSEENDTAVSAVVVESPLEEVGNTSTSQTANEEGTETAAVLETDPESAEPPVLSLEARSSLRRLSNGRRNAGVTL